MIDSTTPFDFMAPIEPWVAIARHDDRMVHAMVSVIEEDGVVRRLNARKMTDAAGLFNEFAGQLDFPRYFGHNWYALVDCLDDLHGSWHGGRPVVVVVGDIDVLIEKDFFALFVSLLCEAAERANLSLDSDGFPRGRAPFPLHFIFFANHDLEGIAERLRERDDILVRESDGCILVSSSPD